jgi:hypothetical protein
MKTLFQNLFSLFTKKHHFDDISKLEYIDAILTKANRFDGKDGFTLSNGDTLIDNDKVIVVNWHIYCRRNQVEEIMANIPKYSCRVKSLSGVDIDVYGNEIKYFHEEYRFTIESNKTNVFIFTFESSEMV